MFLHLSTWHILGVDEINKKVSYYINVCDHLGNDIRPDCSKKDTVCKNGVALTVTSRTFYYEGTGLIMSWTLKRLRSFDMYFWCSCHELYHNVELVTLEMHVISINWLIYLLIHFIIIIFCCCCCLNFFGPWVTKPCTTPPLWYGNLCSKFGNSSSSYEKPQEWPTSNFPLKYDYINQEWR